MWLLIVEALIALGMLVFIVWWTMFAGRRKGELNNEAGKSDEPPPR
jgi:cbb3-type cytochrome oxidase subunit 3